MDKRFTFEKRKTHKDGALDTCYTVRRGGNYIGTVGSKRGEWLACSNARDVMHGFKTRNSAAEYLSALHPPFKSEVKAALKRLEVEMNSPEFLAVMATEI